MNLRLTLILMVLFMVLGTFAIFDPLRSQQQAEEKREREAHVFQLQDKKLERIRVRTGSLPPLEIECTQPAGCPFSNMGEWRLNAPVRDKGDPAAIGAMAGALYNLTQNERLDFEGAPYDPAEFGFDKPSAEVELVVKGETVPYGLKFGKASEVGPNVYLASSRDPRHVFLVPNYSPQILQQDVFHWRNKRLFPGAEPQSITRLSWKGKGLSASASLVDGQWRLEAPVKARAADLMISGLVSTVVYAEAKSVFASSRAEGRAKKALVGKPELEIELASKEGSVRKLLLYPAPLDAGTKGERRPLVAAVAGQDSLYQVESAHFERFHKDLKDYRQHNLLETMARAGAEEIQLRFPREKKQLTLKLEKGQWVYAAGDKPEKAVSQARLNSFLDSLRDAPILNFYPAASQVTQYFRARPADLELSLKSSGKAAFAGAFLVHERKSALVESEGDIKELGEPLLKALPIRFQDLTEAANQQVVGLPLPGKEGSDGGLHQSGAEQRK